MVRVDRDGFFPFVGAVCGFVTHVVAITAVAPDSRSTYALSFAPPGD